MHDEIALNYDDITVIPEKITTITSRKECNPYDEDGYLPIFASCMSSVVSIDNTKDFNKAKIRTVIPRSYSVDDRLKYLGENFPNTPNFVAFSLNEAKDLFVDNYLLTIVKINKYFTEYLDTNLINVLSDKNKTWKTELQWPIKICIDLANGHMKKLLDLVKDIKRIHGDKIIIMTGNIANPETYRDYEEAGVDYCRVGIGGGSVCSTTSNVSVGMPYFSLIKEIYTIKQEIKGNCKIIADGNIQGFRDIQKALIYADYVMIGGLFNKAMESAGKTTYGSFYWNIRGKKIYRPITTLLKYGKEIPKNKYEEVYKLIKENKLTAWKELYGMSTKLAQSLIMSANTQTVKNLKTSEGLLKYQKVEYNLMGWAENETDYLRSAMSYTNSRTLDEYKNSKWTRITQIRYNK